MAANVGLHVSHGACRVDPGDELLALEQFDDRSRLGVIVTQPSGEGVTYASAGVDIEAGERAVDLFKPLATKATRPEVRGGLGGFAGLFALRGGYREPVLAASTDGVGTKLAVAQAMDKHDTVGLDLVAMVVDDLVVCGAEPLFLQDYIAVGRTVPERVAEIVAGIAEGCVQAGCALLGGETAEHPGLMDPDHYDISATGVGVVEADDLLGPERVKPGDVVTVNQVIVEIETAKSLVELPSPWAGTVAALFVEEGQTVYVLLGETPSVFNRQPVEVKAVLTGLFRELLQARVPAARRDG